MDNSDPREWRSYRNFVVGVTLRLIGIVLSFVSSIVTARGLGVEGRGLLYTSTSASSIGAQLLAFGMPSALILAVASRPALARKAIRAGMVASLAAGLAFLIGLKAIWVISPPSWLSPAVLKLGSLVSALIVGQVLLAWCSSLTQGLGLVEKLPIIESLYRGLSTAWAYTALFLLHLSFPAFLGSLILVDWATAAFWLLYLRAVSPSFHQQTRWPSDWARWSMRAYLPLLMNVATRRVDILLLTALGSARASGLYSVAAQAMDLSQIGPVFVGQKAMWSFSAGRGDSDLLQKLRRLLPMLVFAIMVAGGLTADLWSPRIFGRDFVGIGSSLLVLSIGGGALAWETIAVQEINAAGFPLRLSLAWLVSFVVEISLMVSLIPRFGATGAAMALSAAFIVLAAQIYRLRRQIRLSDSPV